MPQGQFLPEGSLINTARNKAINTRSLIDSAMDEHRIVEGIATMCDENHNLIVDFNGFSGIIPRSEAVYSQTNTTAKEIAVISRVGKPVCFEIIGKTENGYYLSRAAAQKRAMDFLLHNLFGGDIVNVRVTHIEPFGAFVDIGCGIVSFIGIEHISISRIANPSERFTAGQFTQAIVTDCDFSRGRISLSCRELLGTWQQNANKFQPGQIVCGIVRGNEEYGAFVELTPNLSGLAEKRDGVCEGDGVSVFIKSIIPEKMKIKLIIIDRLEHVPSAILKPSDFFITQGTLSSWRYSTLEKSGKVTEVTF